MLSSLLRLLSSIVLLAVCLVADAQNRISVKEENFDDMETTAMVNPEKDRNNRDCALVIFHNVEPEGYYFDSGSVFIKAENHVSRENGEKTIFLYISEGAKVITIRHRSDGIVSLRYEFVNGPLQARHTYHVYLGHVEPVNSAARQYLTFEIEPPTASLEVEENPDREPGVFTPWALDASGRASKLLGLGDYRYTVSAPDWHPTAGIVSMRDPNDATVERVRLKSSFGTLTLTGKDLAGATVFVDGRNAGSEGISGYRLAAGEHTVKITRPMYKLFTKTFTVREGEDTRLEISLVPNFTSVELKCADSGADLFVREGGRDRLLGVGSAREPLEAGDYLIVAKRIGHREATRRITVSAGGATSFTIDAPAPIYGSINIVSVPSPAKIDLDGKFSGATPRMLNNVLVGSHRVKVYADGYAPYETTVNVTEGAMAEVKAELKGADNAPDTNPYSSFLPEGYKPGSRWSLSGNKLDNGLQYYIYETDMEPGKVSYYLIRRAGTAVETPQEDGFTHFIEHLAFGPTRRFPSGCVGPLESRGVKFGKGLNAYTALGSTVYSVQGVPTKYAELQDSCLMLLRDWLDGIVIDNSTVEPEKGVIAEEMRLMGNNPDHTNGLNLVKRCFAGSRLANGNVMGSREVIDNVSAATLKDFYRRWYRPDLAAVVVVGDVSPLMDNLIRKHFGSIFKPNTPTPDVDIALPSGAPVNFVVEETPGIDRSILTLNMMLGGCTSATTNNAGVTAWYLNGLVKTALKTVLAPQKIDGVVFTQQLDKGLYDVPAIDSYGVTMHLDGDAKTTVGNVLAALDKLRRDGVTNSQYDEIKSKFIEQVRNPNPAPASHGALANICIDNFAHGIPLTPQRLPLAEQIAPQIPRTVFNTALRDMLSMAFTTCLLNVPEKSKAPTPEALRAAAGR